MCGEAMEDREASVSSSTDFYDSPRRHVEQDPPHTKRKAEELPSSQDKRRRLDSTPATTATQVKPCAGLSPEIWQHIFLSCSLADLGRLLLVNRSFHSYLTDIRNVPNAKPDSGFPRLLKSESIWAAARSAHPTKPPKPLVGFTELQMWQLVWGKQCQFCGRQKECISGEKIWQKGPGSNGVRTIWPFGVRACGPCLLERCRTDSSLLFSTASALRPAIPFAFITADQNYIPAYTLQAATTPAGVEIGKYFFNAHVDSIMRELEEAQSLGPAATEEWSKGLDGRGKERMKASENWERWEVKYQWWSDHHEPKRSASQGPSPNAALQQARPSPKPQTPSPIIYAPVPAFRTLTAAATTAPIYMQPRPPTIPPAVFTPQPVPGPGPGTASVRAERNLHDANEAKASRKADIERRCQQLNPPIPPNVLRHMDSFKAAIQISQPMNDYAWSMLYPRLVAQLPAAQQAESDHVSRLASLTTRAADRRQHDASLKEVKEVLDREWEELQRPVRDKLSSIADDFINQDWDHGKAVTLENSPKFAVDLLMYVRREFYSLAAKDVSETDSADSSRPKLVLENMKWVYDNKLKPITEQFRKELFLCYGNGCEGNFRFYGFEGVIQHFGAKHTNAFSSGNVVVAWREAEWPEETPFHPDPISVKHSHHASSGSTGHGYGSYHGGYSRAGTSTPHIAPHAPQFSPGPHNQQYGGHYNGPFAPPPNVVSGYDYTHPFGAPLDSYSSQPTMAPPGYYVPPTGSTVPLVQAKQPQPKGPDTSMPDRDEDAEHRTNLYDKQVSTLIQMAQDIWKQTCGIKDLPNSVRIYVLLHAVISKFLVEFNHEPILNHFIDALSNHEISKALKNAPGLSCKACQGEASHQSSAVYALRPEERRTYTVLNLLSHFKSQHLGPSTTGYGNGHPSNHQDWKEDMIELPSDRVISGLIHAPGMDDQKLHLIAKVFPALFPTPLPRIGVVDNNGVASPAHSTSKESKDTARNGGTPGVPAEKSGPSSLASPYADSPQPKPTEDEYDPQRPALPAQPNTVRMANRKLSYHGEAPPADRRPRYYAEPRYYVGGSRDAHGRVFGANELGNQVPRDHLDEHYPGPREYMGLPPGARIIRDAGPPYDEYHERRPVYREHEDFYGPEEEIVYAHPREGRRSQEYRPYLQEVRYREDEPRPEYRLVRDPNAEPSASRAKADADRFLEEFDRPEPILVRAPEQDTGPRTEPKPAGGEGAPDDGSHYTPPPPNVGSVQDRLDPGAAVPTVHHTAPSTISNGSRYEEYRRQIPTPDSAGGAPRRVGPHRRRERYHHEHVPSRYYRVAREDPYVRGATMQRSQSRRYERYEETRRRLDQQETPQPNADRDLEPAYSRDQSVDQGPDDHYHPQPRFPPVEYVPIQERLHPYSPTRYRFAGPPEEPRGPPPVYLDEYGPAVHEYEYIRVPRDPRPTRGPYLSHPPTRYVPEHDPEDIQYVPVPLDRPPPQRYDDRPNSYVYYEERERDRAPPPARRPGPATFESDNEPPYEPPDIKVENTAPVDGP
ncbi:hypothetical protein BCR34DRAFT_665504 [Clohesyomyces aquaticus]|uniref:DUF7892 domain-containing protein n=1 Tax=Clohesyomyces aquaticus TaxID=1231657 RepID=A0A1Y1ZGP1_9PLEO|nr:hypothetical protein BCR34DRAFT_665504 [Clohesyomyces aquaticus]